MVVGALQRDRNAPWPDAAGALQKVSTVIAPERAPAVTVRNVGKTYETSTVLHGINIDVLDGEFLAIVGPSGCGKSTLLKIIAGLEDPDFGGIAISGKSCAGVEPRERDVAMVFQSYALYPHMTVAQNIALPLRMRRLRWWQRLPGASILSGDTRLTLKDIQAEVRELARSLGIDRLLDRKPAHLSGGQRQRVAVARAMIRHPAVFLMDEPLSNLDAKLRVEMRSEISALHRRLGVAFIYVTHDQAEAMTMADRVAVMAEGCVLQIASPRQLYSDPADLTVARFVGTPAINCIPGSVTKSGDVELLDAIVPAALREASGTPVTVGVRSEHLMLAPIGEAEIEAEVISVEDHGADLFLHLLAGQDQKLVLRTSFSRAQAFRAGQRVGIRLDVERLLYFSADGTRLVGTSAGRAGT